MAHTETQDKRQYPNDPTPLEALEYIAEAVRELWDASYEEITKADPEYIKRPWDEEQRKIDERITLSAIKERVARKMAAEKEAFSSDYRHEATPLHSMIYRILGSTVGVNCRIWDIQKQTEVA